MNPWSLQNIDECRSGSRVQQRTSRRSTSVRKNTWIFVYFDMNVLCRFACSLSTASKEHYPLMFSSVVTTFTAHGDVQDKYNNNNNFTDFVPLLHAFTPKDSPELHRPLRMETQHNFTEFDSQWLTRTLVIFRTFWVQLISTTTTTYTLELHIFLYHFWLPVHLKYLSSRGRCMIIHVKQCTSARPCA